MDTQQKHAHAVFVVQNARGLHTRPSTALVRCALGFRAQILLTHRGYTADAKSLLDILLLSAKKRSQIMVEATGEDAVEAVAAILELAARRFDFHF